MSTEQTPNAAPVDGMVRRFTVEIKQRYEYGNALTCGRTDEFSEDDGNDVQCLAETVAGCVIASRPYRKWVRDFVLHFTEIVNNHLEADRTE